MKYWLWAYAAALLTIGVLDALWLGVVARAALVGLVCYATYDLTNLATLDQWSWRLAGLDVAWGTLLSAAAGTTASLVAQRLSG